MPAKNGIGLYFFFFYFSNNKVIKSFVAREQGLHEYEVMITLYTIKMSFNNVC